jgi:thiamine-phosphate pyrophosphorylase
MNVREPTLCLVTDRRRVQSSARTVAAELAALEGVLDAAADAGIDVIQIREPDLDAGPLAAFVSRVVGRLANLTRVIVNDRLDVALAAEAHGVHLRGDGPREDRLRFLVPATWLVGRSVHSASEAAEHAGADYLIFGTMFRTVSKGADAPTQTMDALRQAVAASPLPLWAIGGVTAKTAGPLVGAGARGIAAIGAFLDGPSNASNVRERVMAMRRAVAADFAKQVQ